MAVLVSGLFYTGQGIRTNSWSEQAVINQSNPHCICLHVLRAIRRTRVLANLGRIFLRFVCLDYEETDPVRRSL